MFGCGLEHLQASREILLLAHLSHDGHHAQSLFNQ
jgi:hypothetical protein